MRTEMLKFMLRPVITPTNLHHWVRQCCHINIPRAAVCPHHSAPFDYLTMAYFEPSLDQIVWAPRGGGKTRLAAIATLLDLLHKPNTSVRILGGSIEQSMRMWEHLLPDVQNHFQKMLWRKGCKSKCITLGNGSNAAVLTQSQKSVRGLRVQKLRCDEVEMFDPAVWEAAQLITRSNNGVRGSVDALSTLHHPWGLMSRIIDDAQARRARIVRWCLLEVQTHIDAIARRNHGEAKTVTCDPAGKQRNDQTGLSNVALLRASGYQVRYRQSFISDGIELIRAALVNAMGQTKLFIHPRCKQLIKALQAYHYPDKGGELPEKDGEYDHPIDALRYHFINAAERTGGVRIY